MSYTDDQLTQRHYHSSPNNTLQTYGCFRSVRALATSGQCITGLLVQEGNTANGRWQDSVSLQKREG